MRTQQKIIVELDDNGNPVTRFCMLDLAKASAITESQFRWPYSTHDPKTGLGGMGWRYFDCVYVVVEGKDYFLDMPLREVVRLADEAEDEFDDIPF